ncbi:unnamed protein product, partial [Iphiclides podalirius]
MDLFIINRYKGDDVDEDLIDRETKHLQELKQKIEERKKLQVKLQVPDTITLKQQDTAKKTRSGKTLTFVLPIIQILMDEIGHYTRALIVLPVQELALQVAKVCKKYCTNTGLRVALLMWFNTITSRTTTAYEIQ